MTETPRKHWDVRMRGFAERTSVADAWKWIREHASPLESEAIPLNEAAGRVLACGVTSQTAVPNFARAMMDGYAVRADDTMGASSYNPLRLQCVGVVLPGESREQELKPNTCVRIMTGAPLPPGADAVLPAEKAESSDALENLPSQVEALGEVSPGKHVGQPGEDVRIGEEVAQAGRRLRPQDLGVLSSIGVATVSAIRRPRVRIVVTGNELLPPGAAPHGAKIADSNSPMLQALILRDGGIALNPGLVPDSRTAIKDAMHEDADIVLVSGGSSVGQEDFAPSILAEHGELAIHGIAIRPSSPAGMGRLGSRLVFLLPGNPVSCLCAYDMFAGRAIRRLGGLSSQWPYPTVRRRLSRKLVSQIGRVDYARVRLQEDLVEPLAISGASVLSSTTRADGFVLLPANSEGFPAKAEVDVWLYDCDASQSIDSSDLG